MSVLAVMKPAAREDDAAALEVAAGLVLEAPPEDDTPVTEPSLSVPPHLSDLGGTAGQEQHDECSHARCIEGE